MSKPDVSIPHRSAVELRKLVDQAITFADRAEQQGRPIPKGNYDLMCRLYADLDRAIDGHKDNLTRFPHVYGGPKPR